MSVNNTQHKKQVLERLYNDGEQSPESIASDVDLDTKEVQNTISTWESSGLISNTVAIINPNKVGFPVTSYHFINFQKNYDRAIDQGLRQFSRWPGTQLAMVVFGDYDVIARKVSQSPSKLDIFATNVLSSPDTDIDSEFGPQTSQLYDIESVQVTQTIRRNGIDLPESVQRPSDTNTFEDTVDVTDTEAIIIRQLQEDGSLRHRPEVLAAEVAASTSEVKSIIDRLEDTGVIEKYARRIDPNAGGWYRAFFAVSVERGRYDDVTTELSSERSATIPSIRSGLGHNWADIFIEIIFKSIEEIDEITDKIRSIDGVKSSRTFLGTRSPYLDEKLNPKS